MNVGQIGDSRKIVPIVSVQNRYSISATIPDDVLAYCEKEEIGFIPWFPLAAGKLSGSESPVSQVAARLKATPSQIALAWLLAGRLSCFRSRVLRAWNIWKKMVKAAGLKLDAADDGKELG